jgi:hypothetical protein
MAHRAWGIDVKLLLFRDRDVPGGEVHGHELIDAFHGFPAAGESRNVDKLNAEQG